MGSGDGQFNYPYGVAVDSSGNVYVADTDNHRIQKFDSSGGFITKWGSYGSGDGQFDYPSGVAVDSSGNVYVADGWNYHVQKFTLDLTVVDGVCGASNGGPFPVCPDNKPLQCRHPGCGRRDWTMDVDL